MVWGPILTILRMETRPVGCPSPESSKAKSAELKALACAAALPQQTARLLQQSPEVTPSWKMWKFGGGTKNSMGPPDIAWEKNKKNDGKN